nr:FctA domain-containing protein [Clostridium indicum]
MLPQTAHAAGTPAEVTLTVEQVFSTNAAGVNDVFSYELIADEANPMPAGSSGGVYSFTAAGTGSVKIHMNFPDTGVYNYTVRCSSLAASLSGYVYDDQIYRVTVTVTRQGGGKLAALVVVQKADNNKSASLRFSHSYVFRPSDPSIMVDPPVKKTVSGNPRTDSVFTFKLTAGNPANPMPAGSANGVKTMTIVGSGEKDFGTWAYTTEGTYYYTISEVNTQERGYTYDTAVYTITDVVKAVNNQLTVSRTVTNHLNKPVTACIFINRYKISSGGGGGNGGGTNPGGGVNPGDGTNPGGGSNPVDGTNPEGGSNPIDDINPGDGTNPGGNEGPRTGDDTGITLYMVVLAAGITAAAGSVFGLLYLKKREKKKYADAN